MADTIVVTKASALARSAEVILARFKETDGHLHKGAILDILAKEIAGDRQSWGGLKRHVSFVGEGVTSVRDIANTKSEDDQAQEKARPIISAQDLPQSEVVASFRDVAITRREMHGLRIATEIFDGRLQEVSEQEYLYNLIRPVCSVGKKKLPPDIERCFTKWLVPELADAIHPQGEDHDKNFAVRDTERRRIHYLIAFWVAIRFDAHQDDWFEIADAVIAWIRGIMDAGGDYSHITDWHFDIQAEELPESQRPAFLKHRDTKRVIY